jgi:peptidoglycan hydrolase-like protein with peptidoglycan-binding domain
MKRFALVLLCLVLAASASPAAGTAEIVGYQPLQYGDSGDEVVLIQEQLNMLGYYAGKINGYYLDGTRQAVLRFQADYGLSLIHI